MQTVNTDNIGPVSSDEEPTIAPRKTKRKRFPLSFVVVALAILGAVIYLVYANTQSNSVYYMTVPELHHCSICETESVRVAGVVLQNSVQHDDQGRVVSFTISDSGKNVNMLPVTYSGVVPDIFRPGVQVVVEGHYTGSGPFQAQTLLAKCPSKFQSATPTAN